MARKSSKKPRHEIRRVALTGGPAAGKTAVLDVLGTGFVPRWVQNAQSLGHPIDAAIFQ